MSKKVLIPLIILFTVIFLGVVGAIVNVINEPKTAAPKEKTPEVNAEEVYNSTNDESAVEGKNQARVETDETKTEADTTWDDLKEKDKIIGKSDKDFKAAVKDKPTKVRNDQTGKWRKTSIAESIDIEEYALSYQKEYMKDDEVHFIVNFTRNTTTWLNATGGLLAVEIREHVRGEEHDAKTLGSGMVLKSYIIYPDGDIQELDV
ncbi:MULTISPECIES: hypothetical protein [Sporosarcina]|uniref:Uncharacterized protein n=1 Tax=Sporosarcina contaminans TaxID=633403 RepID=A0ABW3U031_9BACL